MDLIAYILAKKGIAAESARAQEAEQALQDEIDNIEQRTDVVDVVDTYADLENYDVSTISDNDVIKVLVDETHDDAISYYRYIAGSADVWEYVGSIDSRTYRKFRSDWDVTGTTEAFLDAIFEDNTVLDRYAYLGDVELSDMPFVGNGEALIVVTQGPAGRVVSMTLSSGDVAPYIWKCTYWGFVGSQNKTFSGWKSFIPTEDITEDVVDSHAKIPTSKAVYDRLLSQGVSYEIVSEITHLPINGVAYEEIDD